MSDSSVTRLRNAVAKVELLLGGLAPLPIEAWESPVLGPADFPVAGADGEVPRLTRDAAAEQRQRTDGAPGESDDPAEAALEVGLSADDLTDRLRAQADAAELRVAAAADVERILMEARQVAEQLHAEERRAADVMLAQARQVAEQLEAEERDAAEATLAQAQQVAEQLQAGEHTAQ